ncbi:MAG: flippase activity-associated protein Agl23 [Chthoniobacteraceae bacterium]
METESGGISGAEGNTASAPRATSHQSHASHWSHLSHAPEVAILLLAVLLRLWSLDLKPAHFDEGVNGFFVDAMAKNGYYHYDATNFHGPLHFYVLFVAQTLLGREAWALRLPLALASIACVAVMLFGFRRFVSVKASRWAALAMAVSPGFVFYGRYAIHETWLVLFLMLLVIGLAGMWREGRVRDLWLTGIGFAGIVLTKETWVIHALALGLGGATLALLERFSPSAAFDRGPTRFATDDVARVGTICAAVVLFFYSGCLLDPSGIAGFVQAYAVWTKTGTAGESGHEHPWNYWLDLLAAYEWPVLLGAVAALVVVAPHTNRFVRWLAITALGTLVAYALIPYKTPWCLIAWAWPFLLVFGVAAEWLMARVDRWTVAALALLICGFSFAKSRTLNFVKFTDEEEPYVYVQTTPDVNLLLDPLRWQLARDPSTRYRPAHVLQEDKYPLLWLLGDRPNITWDDHDAEPEPLDAEWLLVDSAAKDRVEPALTAGYFRETLHIRGMAPDKTYLYLRAESFAGYYGDRRPDIPAKP